jgi:hypothetical protein
MALLSLEILDTILEVPTSEAARQVVVGSKEWRGGKSEQIRPRVQGHEAKPLMFVMMDFRDVNACAAHTGVMGRKRGCFLAAARMSSTAMARNGCPVWCGRVGRGGGGGGDEDGESSTNILCGWWAWWWLSG